MKLIIPKIFILAFISSPVCASKISLLKCEEKNSRLTKCSVHSEKIAEPIRALGETWDTSYRFSYNFECSGHRLEWLTLSTKENKKYIPFGKNGIIELSGHHAVYVIDDHPTTTRHLSFKANCKLFIELIDQRPSLTTERMWSTIGLDYNYRIAAVRLVLEWLDAWLEEKVWTANKEKLFTSALENSLDNLKEDEDLIKSDLSMILGILSHDDTNEIDVQDLQEKRMSYQLDLVKLINQSEALEEVLNHWGLL